MQLLQAGETRYWWWGVLAQRFEIGEDRFGEGVVVLLPARAVAGDGLGLVVGAAVKMEAI